MSFPAFVQYTFCFGILHISILWRKIILFKCQRFYSSFCCMKTCVHGNVAYQLISVTQSCLTLCNPMDLQHPRLPCPSLTLGACSNSCPSSQWFHPTILCRPLFLLPSVFPGIRVFSNELAPCIMWLKYWSFSLSISHSSEYSGLISFRIDWFDAH